MSETAHTLDTTTYEIRHFHLFCGLGGGAKGFNRANPRHQTPGGRTVAGKFRCVGGIDVNAAAIRDFERASGVVGTVLDLFSREQYIAFHGKEPPRGWREVTTEDILRASGYEHPHIAFLSAPCKGLSGLLSESMSKTRKYQALNQLTVRGVMLMLEAHKDDPIETVLFENVPRIQNRGRYLLDQIEAVFRAYGYISRETTHDCGELGGLAQTRKRFLLVARHQERVPSNLFAPETKRLRGVGEVLDRMPLPGDPRGGPMHRVPSLQWSTWVRLAFVEAGQDWRSLNKLKVEGGVLADYALAPNDWRSGVLGVTPWSEPTGTVTGRSTPTNGTHSVADPRFNASARWNQGQQYGVLGWQAPAPTIGGQNSPGQGRFAVADPRAGVSPSKQNNCFKVVRWADVSPAVTGGTGPSSGGLCVADPRPTDRRGGAMGVVDWSTPAGIVADESLPSNGNFAVADPRVVGKDDRSGAGVLRWTDTAHTVTGQRSPLQGSISVADPRPIGASDGRSKYRVTAWDEPSGCVIAASTTGQGAFSVADPRTNLDGSKNYLTGGHYGVVSWDGVSGAVSGAACLDNGRWSVADPRPALPEAADRLVAVIQSADGTWHRPFTTLELAALQSLVDPEEYLLLDGLSDAEWRERIGNAVPPDAAEAIAETFGRTLLAAWTGERFRLSSVPIWVNGVAVALSV